MYSFQDYLRDVLAAYDSSPKTWTQETRAKNSLVSASYDSCHALHIGADRKLSLEELVMPDACERFATEIRLCLSKGNSEDQVVNSICEAAKRAIEAGIAADVSVVQASFRVVVARR